MHSYSSVTGSLSACAGLAVTAALVLAGCSSGHDPKIAHAAAPSATKAQHGTALSAQRKYEASVRAYTKCATAHGATVSHNSYGDALLNPAPNASKSEIVAVANACDSLLVHNPKDPKPSYPPLSAAAYAQAKRFARCVRSHGVPNAPDPSRSTDPNSAEYKHEQALENAIDKSTPTFKHAYNTCEASVYNVRGGVG